MRNLSERVNNGCTGCRYCIPCPAGVNIPDVFWVWNQLGMYKRVAEGTMHHWNNVLTENQKPDKCIKCGKRERVCTQRLAIRNDLEKVHLFMNEIQGR